MYEDKTFEALLKEAKGEIPDSILKSEGSLVHNALAALSFEAEKIYIQMDYIMNQAYADTADIEHLERIAASRAIYRKKATNAYMKGEFDVDVLAGARFNLAGYNFSVRDELEGQHIYSLRCEEAGAGANGLRGTMTAIDYVANLSKMELTDLLVAGEDDETQEALLKRYLESFSVENFAGNVAAYKNYIAAIPGIGGCKVFPVWNGAGTVKAVLIGADLEPVSDYLVAQVQGDVCPVPGAGYGWAPIDHDVTVESVNEVSIAVRARITFSNGYSWAVCEDDILSAVRAYFRELREAWPDGSDEDSITVYISKIESAVLDVQGVIDVYDTTLNGSESNVTLTPVQVPKLESVVVI